MFSTRTYADSEINAGIAPFLEPAELRREIEEDGGQFASLPVFGLGCHYFLAVARTGNIVWLTPLTSNRNGPGWLPVTGKVGHPDWVEKPTYFHPKQLLPVPVSAVIRAARAGNDLTHRGERNRVSSLGLNAVIEAVGSARQRGAFNAELDPSEVTSILWEQFWSQYRAGEIWKELRLSSTFLPPNRVRLLTGKT